MPRLPKMLEAENKKKTLTLPSPASGRGEENGAPADAPLLPLAGEGWDEGLVLLSRESGESAVERI